MERSRELHWQEQWANARLALGVRQPGHDKFYAIVAYPGSSGFLHLGHLRGLLLADALHRQQRMEGRAVFFPTGTHASGLPSVTFARKVKDRDATVVQQLRDNQVSEEEWPRLEDPAYAARYLGRSYLELYSRLGILVDESAYLTTIDDDYQAFIRWQCDCLEKRGALVRGAYYISVCPVCGPVSVDPSETDLSSGGEAETIVYTLVPFRLDDGRVLLAATLRPETVFGATNLWIDTKEALTVWHHRGGEYLVGRSGGERLVEQHGGHLGASVPAAHLYDRLAQVPLVDRKVPILPSRLVDAAIGTGVVMSVPGHAPSDWLGFLELPAATRATIGRIPVIIEVPVGAPLSPSERQLSEGPGAPAERASRACGAHSLDDTRARQEATERLYRLELVRGEMHEGLTKARGVGEARLEVARTLAALPGGGELREFSEAVVCRNGHSVIIRKVPDQWFIRYSWPEWKDATKRAISSTRVYPAEYGRELPDIIDWFQDRPAIRQGSWLGTPFPLDPSWIIEPIADSTFYPAYFIVRRFVNDGRIATAQLTPAFFDAVFLGQGPGEPTVSEQLAREVRAEFEYWYPLDLNIGGKEHKRVHFPVFLYTHTLLLPPEQRPRGLFVHWWLVRSGGGKISKKEVSSKGGAIPPFREAIDRWGADAIRLYSLVAASPQQDIEWRPDEVDRSADRLTDVERLAREIRASGVGATPELDAWLSSEVHDLVVRVRHAMDARELRDAAEAIFGALPSILRRYRLRGGEWGDASQRVGDAWVRMMSPFVPHLAEEVGLAVGSGLVASARFPRPEEFPRSEPALRAEAFIAAVESDLREVVRLARDRGEAADGVAFFVAAPWKQSVERWLRDWAKEGGKGDPVGEVMKRARLHPEMTPHLAEIPRYVQRVAPLVRSEGGGQEAAVEEPVILRGAEGYFARRFDFRLVRIVPEAEGANEDPLHRRERARPGRPAFYLFGVHGARPTAVAGDDGES